MSLLAITVQTEPSSALVKLSGESDITNAGQLRDALNAQLSTPTRHVAIDLSALQFADSSAIGIFISAHRTLNAAGGTLELLHPQPVVATALRLMGVDQLLTVRDDGP
jgi:anti-anti-sigma factor